MRLTLPIITAATMSLSIPCFGQVTSMDEHRRVLDSLAIAARLAQVGNPPQQVRFRVTGGAVSASGKLMVEPRGLPAGELLIVVDSAASAAADAVSARVLDSIQTRLVRQAGGIILTMGSATESANTVLSALRTGVKMGLTASPFVSPTFSDKYGWLHDLINFAPAVTVAIPIIAKTDLGTTRVYLGVGLALQSIAALAHKPGRNAQRASAAALSVVADMADLFDFNRLVYQDMMALGALMQDAENFDSTLVPAFDSLFLLQKNELQQLDDAALRTNPNYRIVIQRLIPLLHRYGIKRERINAVLARAQVMIEAYARSEVYVSVADTTNQRKMAADIRAAVDSLNAVYGRFKDDHWQKLQGTYYQVTPEIIQDLRVFYEIERQRTRSKK